MNERVSIFMLLELCLSPRLNWMPGMMAGRWEDSAPGNTGGGEGIIEIGSSLKTFLVRYTSDPIA